MNRAQVAGNITEPKYFPGEMPRLILSVADRFWNRKKGEEETQWVDCAVFGKRAEKLSEKLGKGDFICAVGTFRLSKFEDKKGNWHRTVTLLVDDMEIRYSIKSQQRRNPVEHDPGVEPYSAPPQDTRDIPF